MRRMLVALACGALLAGASLTPAFAAANPSGSGQPNTSCETPGFVMPPGFMTTGFANAQTVYAGVPGTPSAANGNVHAVSQYDVACFQQTMNH
jgi:hypothetical protein